jgi:hypothetical protein
LAGVARTALISGNEYRTRPVLVNDIIEMCGRFLDVDDPVLTNPAGQDPVRWMLSHVAYEQFPERTSLAENVGRSLVLFRDHAAASPDGPDPHAWEQVLGVSLEQYLYLGLLLNVAALENEGRVDRSLLMADHFAPFLASMGVETALRTIDRHFAATPEQLRNSGAARERRGLEKWSFNPLTDRPLVAVSRDRFVIPIHRKVLDKVTPTGLYFSGLSAFNRTFTINVGRMFESYVGAQLDLLAHADARPEVEFERGQLTVDFFLVTPEVVILIEA